MTRSIDLGLLFSTTGPYHLLGQASRAGALQAIAEVNADPALDLTFNRLLKKSALKDVIPAATI